MSAALSQKEFAEFLDLSDRQVRNLAAEGMPTEVKGRRRTYGPAAMQWYLSRIQERSKPRGGAKERLAAASADLKELELSQRRSLLVPVAEVAGRVRAPLEAVDASLRTAKRRHGKAWARRLKVTQATAMSLIGELAEEVRAELREVVKGVADAA